jgi:hypothetical protein
MDVSTETPLSLKDVADLVGKHVATVYRWSTTGVRGVVLETLQIGGTRFTSREALQRFCERLTPPDTRHVAPATNSAEKAARELERYGV